MFLPCINKSDDDDEDDDDDNKFIIIYNKLTSSNEMNSNSSFMRSGLSPSVSVVIVVNSVMFLVNLGKQTVFASGRVMPSIF